MPEAGGSEKNYLVWDEAAGHLRRVTEAEAAEVLRPEVLRRLQGLDPAKPGKDGHPMRALLGLMASEWKILAGLAAVAVTLIIAVAVALGGGIYAAVPGQGSAANGGVYVINKFTGYTYWCPPSGGCRAH